MKKRKYHRTAGVREKRLAFVRHVALARVATTSRGINAIDEAANYRELRSQSSIQRYSRWHSVSSNLNVPRTILFFFQVDDERRRDFQLFATFIFLELKRNSAYARKNKSRKRLQRINGFDRIPTRSEFVIRAWSSLDASLTPISISQFEFNRRLFVEHRSICARPRFPAFRFCHFEKERV